MPRERVPTPKVHPEVKLVAASLLTDDAGILAFPSQALAASRKRLEKVSRGPLLLAAIRALLQLAATLHQSKQQPQAAKQLLNDLVEPLCGQLVALARKEGVGLAEAEEAKRRLHEQQKRADKDHRPVAGLPPGRGGVGLRRNR